MNIKMNILFTALFLTSHSLFAFEITGLDNNRIESRYSAQELDEISTNSAYFSPTNSSRSINSVLAQFGGKANAAGNLFQPAQSTDSSANIWQGTAVGNPGIKYQINRITGRIRAINSALMQSNSVAPPAASISEQKAVNMTKGLIASLAKSGIVNIKEMDLKNLKITKQISGSAPTKSPDKKQEWVEAFHIAAKRVIDGVPVVGNYVHVAITNQGELQTIDIANRPLTRGKGTAVPIDITPQKAIENFKSSIERGANKLTEVSIEKWGLAYVDVGSESQSEIQPAYVFIATPLAKTKQGVAAGRKLIRVIPASSRSIAQIGTDPFPKKATNVPTTGDSR